VVRSIESLTAGVTVFNTLPDDQVTDRLSSCLHAAGWAASLLAGRPYPDRESLLATAYRFGVVLDDADLASALSAHPRIGERPTGNGVDAAHSRAEQGGVDAADLDLAQRLHAGNVAYEEKFGQVFLIRAAGRDGEQILAALTERLSNDPETEARVVRDQLAQIAQLRLAALLDELAAADPTPDAR
jgi:2-oxo-4-hydroxy-4-carboxy-5-ureidoimidazoline decarboxylase